MLNNLTIKLYLLENITDPVPKTTNYRTPLSANQLLNLNPNNPSNRKRSVVGSLINPAGKLFSIEFKDEETDNVRLNCFNRKETFRNVLGIM